jgi:hypothetical protein
MTKHEARPFQATVNIHIIILLTYWSHLYHRCSYFYQVAHLPQDENNLIISITYSKSTTLQPNKIQQ